MASSAYPQRVPDAGTTSSRRERSTCPSTHASPRPYDVWLAASEVSSRPDFSSDASDCAHEYGVAGSWVVPTTTIGGAPGAWMGAVRPSGATGHKVQGNPSQTPDAPK